MTELADRELLPAPYDLADRYRVGGGTVVLTGVQAIARQLVEQHVRDLRAGRRVGTFVSGYQGSPLGGVDRMLAGMPEVLSEHDIRFVPGLNEELAATAVWGSQGELPDGAALTHDGVVGVWYGKGPGLDRSTDALRHANMYGANPNGGVLLLVGDDPASKSSTVPAVSERSLAAMNIPVLFPRNAREIITMGLHGVALSRVSGCLVALKIVADVADGAWTVDGSVGDIDIVVPEIQWEGRPFTYRQRPMAAPTDSVIAEADLYGPRWELVKAYSTLNDLDVIEIDPPHARIGIAATGTTFDAVRQALIDLGVDDEALHRAGVRLLRIGMPFPVAPQRVLEFARGLERLIVVEDKTAFIETQIREILYGTPDAPQIVGKRDGQGRPLFDQDGELTAGRIAKPLRRVLDGHLEMKRPLPQPLSLAVLPSKRAAYFCSGCPHNRSTAVPEGSLAGGGIGCHTMVTMSGRDDSKVLGLTQMGGEGAQWIGLAPFTEVPHLFQNIGDGTYFHSGQLAVQACIAAGVNITYKLLYNDVVAMTGAQDAEGALAVPRLTHKLAIEGVKQIIVCADEPKKYRKRDLAPGTLLWHRDRLDEAQRALREIPGVTVLIYDQHCAADARRQRKRGTLPTRNTRVVINEAVCEGCGDCGVKSNCLSVQPVETEFGRKTRIDQTSCNTDYSCLDGDCPSFVTVELPDPAKAKARKRTRPEPPALPDLELAAPTTTQNVFLAGIGGTGIVTVNQVLATAAMRAGYEVASLDQIGLSQKAGPVVSHLRFAPGELEPSNRLTPASADCIVAFDLLAATDNKNLAYGSKQTTLSVASTSKTPTGEMVYDKSVTYPETALLLSRLENVSRTVHSFDALAAAEELFGNTTAANFLLVGAAYQLGGLRLPAAAIEEAIEINGVAVAANIAAFRWGRAAVARPAEFAAATTRPQPERTEIAVPADLFDGLTATGETRRLVELRAVELIGFQGARVAREYVATVQRIWAAQRAVTDRTEFSEQVARGLYKFTAYKDEYEVARRLVDPAFLEEVSAQVPEGANLTYKLHPPILRALGRKKKIGFGPRGHVALKVLAKGKRLRGTKFDPFGYMHVRKVERALLAHYTDMVTALADTLATDYNRAVRAAALADVVRGYEDVKLASVETYRNSLRELGIEPPALP
ncbi:indolepyruvate ferredoxin oxidoreductase family protein [Nocardia sp. CDC159]|uniref:Indolepyruvate ferredoxin oxidoreductase family protein n=1 Tax=Nocardia pulmonis TaxID=2951408 RepID=A0A9X2E9Z8_9NOCA|nr:MULTISPECIES: indolepyruvate ferredoxin oxidoreductase family protein [Nocardia]MCM6774268.1 indolepyruvate ferredoxin oxidoreductase family protein [Nocardia pulmonis]MCM6787155.1 indolepyruvate ferredoxin oxidoreductase family protein [Nocardia sp. CDC159]